MINKIRNTIQNRWVRFSFITITYILWFVVWGESLWPLLGLPIIYDLYISQLYKKLFWNRHTEIKRSSKTYNSAMGWIESLLFAVVAATLLRTYFVEMYVIPSPSMENTLLVGDYIGVSKISYGPKTPNTPLSFPLVHNVNPFNPSQKSYLDWIKYPYKRLKGFNSVKNDDVIVFNFPQGDSVMLIAPQNNYYEAKRRYSRPYLESQTEIIYHPVDKRDNYIKRAVAIPSDVIEIIQGDLFINGVKESPLNTMQHRYSIELNKRAITYDLIQKLDISQESIIALDALYFEAFLTEGQYKELSSLDGVVSSSRFNVSEPDINVFPYDTLNYKFSAHQFGPISIPKKGKTVKLNINNLSLYSRIIDIYEENSLEVKDSVIYINNAPADSYTFKMDYYFAMGDNRDNSLDSRYFGFVPEDHLVGKATFIWFSTDKSKSFPKNIRFNRLFNSIK